MEASTYFMGLFILQSVSAFIFVCIACGEKNNVKFCLTSSLIIGLIIFVGTILLFHGLDIKEVYKETTTYFYHRGMTKSNSVKLQLTINLLFVLSFDSFSMYKIIQKFGFKSNVTLRSIVTYLFMLSPLGFYLYIFFHCEEQIAKNIFLFIISTIVIVTIVTISVLCSHKDKK